MMLFADDINNGCLTAAERAGVRAQLLANMDLLPVVQLLFVPRGTTEED